MDSARHVIQLISNPVFLRQMTFYDVTSAMIQSLPRPQTSFFELYGIL
jgi:hypothetical protein